jgi:hypothetical protein
MLSPSRGKSKSLASLENYGIGSTLALTSYSYILAFIFNDLQTGGA